MSISQDVHMVGPFDGNFNNSTDRIALEKPQFPDTHQFCRPPGSSVDEIIYSDREPWPSAADGAGFALQRVLR